MLGDGLSICYVAKPPPKKKKKKKKESLEAQTHVDIHRKQILVEIEILLNIIHTEQKPILIRVPFLRPHFRSSVSVTYLTTEIPF